jgi:Mn2+/Fe2+ NRAMP family transporter
MGEALRLLVGGPAPLYAIGFAVLSLALEVAIPFPRYAPVLKLLTLSLFAYVLTAVIIDVPWHRLAIEAWPPLRPGRDYLVTIVAVFGTTISPYLFFWQASEEAEEEESAVDQLPLSEAPEQARSAFERIRVDTDIGMFYSNVVAFFIMLTTAVVLHPRGITDINTSAQAAQALEPLAGRFASALFAAGIVGTGLLAVPILAGSAAYAVAEGLDQQAGLGRKPRDAKLFYLIIVGAMVLGTLLSFSPIDPIRMLFWSAVINGVISVPLMIGIMWVATHKAVMGAFAVNGTLRWLGWAATAAMALVVIGMLL